MEMIMTVYLIGDAESLETNEWLHLTTTRIQAGACMDDVGKQAVCKALTVREYMTSRATQRKNKALTSK